MTAKATTELARGAPRYLPGLAIPVWALSPSNRRPTL